MPNEPIDIDKLIAQAREKNLAGGWRYQEWIRMMADALAQLRAERDAALKCSTCDGNPESHPSKLRCVCDDGTRNGEVLGLRNALFEVLGLRNALFDALAKRDAAVEREDAKTKALEAVGCAYPTSQILGSKPCPEQTDRPRRKWCERCKALAAASTGELARLREALKKVDELDTHIEDDFQARSLMSGAARKALATREAK